MKNLVKYRFSIETIFYHFLNKGLNVSVLEGCLKDFQQFIRESEGFSEDAGLWFRFFDSDNGAHTISDVINGLQSSVNREFYMDCLEGCIGLDVQSELQVYFS